MNGKPAEEKKFFDEQLGDGSFHLSDFPARGFPALGKREFDFPATTTFRLYIDQLNRARYYKLLSFGGNATYDFQPTRTSRHSITPFKLTFNVLQHQSEEFRKLPMPILHYISV